MSKYNVIPESEATVEFLQDLVLNLNIKLNNLHYSTKTCVCCEWVHHEDDMENECSECGYSICDQCVASGENSDSQDCILICATCHENLQNSESEDE